MAMGRGKNSGRSAKDRIKGLRDEQLRDYLAKRGKIQYIFDNIEKMEDLCGQKDNSNSDMEPLEYQRLAKATELRVRMSNKLLADLKSVEHKGTIELPEKKTKEELEQRLVDLGIEPSQLQTH